MNLKKAKNYSIGLDIGTNSVGWAVIDEDTGQLFHYHGKPTWGSRLFTAAETAGARRAKRGMRRRYDRRRFRINLLQEIFAEEVGKVDPKFFTRMKQSRLVPQDRSEDCLALACTFFNDPTYTDANFYESYPSIYHLRQSLVEGKDKKDIRLVYLAIHHIVKYRGNFLREGENLSSQNSDLQSAVRRFLDELREFSLLNGWDLGLPESSELTAELQKKRKFNSKDKDLCALFKIEGFDKKEKEKLDKAVKCLVNAILGYKANFSDIFDLEGLSKSEVSFYLREDEKVEMLKEKLPDDYVGLFESLQIVYSGKVLAEILSRAPGKTISANKVAEYEQHHKDLEDLKKLAHSIDNRHGTGLFNEFFAEDRNAKGNKATYSTYVGRGTKCTQEDLIKNFEDKFQHGDLLLPEERKTYDRLFGADNKRFLLKKLRTAENIVIPYQLHLEELELIIDNQAAYYPFLKQNKDKIMSLVSYRIPYYVGPLIEKQEDNPRSKFSWMIRNKGFENQKIYPWNAEEVINKEATAAAFIENLVGNCTYLWDKDTLPKHSLLYEEFCVLNELNGIKWNKNGLDFVPLDVDLRIKIFDEIFREKASVSVKCVEEWLKKEQGAPNCTIKGYQGEGKFASSLSSYNKFKRIFHVDEIPDSEIPFIEKLILYCTVFEDKKIRINAITREFKKRFGESLTERQQRQIKKVAQISFNGWGNLSRELLSELKTETCNGKKSIIDLMREGDPVALRSMTFMQALNSYDFIEQIDKHNESITGMTIDDIPGSPAIKRGVNQAIKIIDEIIEITGKQPKKINLEVTRSNEEKKRSTSKSQQIEKALSALQDQIEAAHLKKELNLYKNNLNEKLELYFRQRGKCAYSGEPLDINQLSSYHVDHIVPRAYTKDDSIENKVLCKAITNEDKADNLLINPQIIRKMRPEWKSWFDAGLIGEKKFNNLTRTKISDKQKREFIARQLVQTSQIVRHTKRYVETRYPDVEVMNIKAGLSSDLRRALKLAKCRSVNDYHHAHDAFIASQISRYIDIRFDGFRKSPYKYDFIMSEKIEKLNDEDAKSVLKYGYFVGGFLHTWADRQTGEVIWDSQEEISYIKRALNYKDCCITHRLAPSAGSFWDETIYPVGDIKAQIPLKIAGSPNAEEKGLYLSVDKYGGKHKFEAAYFFLWTGCKKNGKRVSKFSIYPRYKLASGVSVETYMYEIAESAGLTHPQLVLPRVYSSQKIKYNNDEFGVAACDALVNARQFVLDEKSLQICSKIEKGSDVDEDQLDYVLDYIKQRLPFICSKMNVVIQALDDNDAVKRLSPDAKKELIVNLLGYISGKSRRIDLMAVGGSKTAGGISSSGIWSECLKGANSELYIIDESVTGLRLRSQRVGI